MNPLASRALAARALAALAAATLALTALPAVAGAQKALVYCPVGIDVAGCDRAVAALAPDFPDGVDRGYDGSAGTVDVKTADLWSYAVLVVPSLADGSDRAPYALLRDAVVSERLHDALMGRVALWSGTPDQGTTNRDVKDALLRSLARWAAGNYGTVKGPGLVALQDLSDVVATRYGWLKALTGLTVTADSTVLSYASVRAMTATGAAILANGSGSTFAYTNMASLGFYLPQGAANVTLDAVGQTGTTQGGQVVLVTSPGGNSGSAVIRTDKDDYPPGTTVTITGTGFQPGETVNMVLHEDPVLHENRTLTSVADASGGFVNTSFAPEAHDIGVRFILTATGATSGVRAEATFTDGNPQSLGLTTVTGSVVVGSSATYTIAVVMGGNSDACRVTLAVSGSLPVGATPSFSSNPVTGAGGGTLTSTLTISTTNTGPVSGRTPPGTYPFTVTGTRGAPGCQGNGTLTANGTLTVTAPANQAPVANPQSVTAVEDVASSITLTGSDADGNPLTYTVTSSPAHGTLTGSAPALTYTPAANYNGGDSFTFKVNDGTVDSPAATVSITVTPVNDAPVALNDSHSVNEDATLTVAAPGVVGNDTDVEGQALSAALVTGPAHGTLALNADGSFSYTPSVNYNGSDSFTYRASDGSASSAAATVTISIAPVNDAPLAVADAYSTDEDTPLNVAVPGVLANDTDVDGPALSAILVSGPAHGTLALNANGSFTYTPAADYYGADGFSYRASDGTLTSAPVSVSLTVAPVNDAPIASSQSISTDEDVAKSLTLAGTDPEGDALTYIIVSGPGHGTLSGAGANRTYTPAANYNGGDSFTFKVNDGTVDSPAATVSITVVPVNDAPVAQDDAYNTNEDTPLTVAATLALGDGQPGVLANDSDVDGDAITAVLVAGPAHGTLVLNANGSFTYTPAPNYFGTDAFTYRASDGTLTSNVATATITIAPVNDAPSFAKGADQTALEDAGATSVATWATSISAGPSESQSLDFVVTNDNNALFATQPAVASNGTLTFTPAANKNGTASVTVRLHDDGGTANGGVDTSPTQTFTVTVTAVNDAPSFTKGADVTVSEDAPAQTITPWATAISAGPSDESGQTVAFTVANANNGLFSVQPAVAPNGTLTFTPSANANGSATVTVTLKDNGGTANGGADASAAQTFTITISSVNDAPEIAPIAAQTGIEGTAVTFTAVATDPNDNPPDALSFSLVGAPAGAAIDPTTGAFSWTPPDNGTFSFSVRVTDNGSNSGAPTPLTDATPVTITVGNAAPVFSPDMINGLPAGPVAAGSAQATVTATASFTDAGTADTHGGSTITWDLDNIAATTEGATVSETNGSGTLSRTRALSAGVYTVRMIVLDDDNMSDTTTARSYIVVYDPTAGFVTGGGWILSPVGACTLASCAGITAESRANFGFVAKYQNGATKPPTGSTEFQFQAGNLNFKSSSYEWLVVGGARAQYKGAGTINGGGSYGFLLTAVDGAVAGGGGVDKFRIKIWDLTRTNPDGSYVVVYDNQRGQSEDSGASTALVGGSIVIHTNGK